MHKKGRFPLNVLLVVIQVVVGKWPNPMHWTIYALLPYYSIVTISTVVSYLVYGSPWSRPTRSLHPLNNRSLFTVVTNCSLIEKHWENAIASNASPVRKPQHDIQHTARLQIYPLYPNHLKNVWPDPSMCKQVVVIRFPKQFCASAM